MVPWTRALEGKTEGGDVRCHLQAVLRQIRDQEGKVKFSLCIWLIGSVNPVGRNTEGYKKWWVVSGEEVWKIEFGNRHIWCWPNRQLSVANGNWCSVTIWKCRYAAWKKGLLINLLHIFLLHSFLFSFNKLLAVGVMRHTEMKMTEFLSSSYLYFIQRVGTWLDTASQVHTVKIFCICDVLSKTYQHQVR